MEIYGTYDIEMHVKAGGLVLQNTVTESMRDGIASFMQGGDVQIPTHIAIGDETSLTTETLSNKVALNSEQSRSEITSRFLQGSDTVRYTAIFGIGVELNIKQMGLFSDSDLWAVVDVPQGLQKAINERINVYWFISMTRGGAELALVAFDREQLVVTDTQVNQLTLPRYQPTGGAAPARRATVYVRTGVINYTMLGNSNPPTNTSGIGPVTQMNEWSDAITIDGLTNVANFRAIATSGTAIIEVDYYR